MEAVKLNGKEYRIADLPEITLGTMRKLKREGLDIAKAKDGDLDVSARLILYAFQAIDPEVTEAHVDALTIKQMTAISRRITGGGADDADF